MKPRTTTPRSATQPPELSRPGSLRSGTGRGHDERRAVRRQRADLLNAVITRPTFLASVDGVNFNVLWESGLTGDGPGAAKRAFSGDYAFYGSRRFVRRAVTRYVGMADRECVVVTLKAYGTLASQADQWVVSPSIIGFGFRVVRFGIYCRAAPGSGSVSVTGRRGSAARPTAGAASDPTVPTGAGGSALSAQGTLLPGPSQRFSGALGDELHLDLNAANGGTDCTVFLTLERVSTTPVQTNDSTGDVYTPGHFQPAPSVTGRNTRPRSPRSTGAPGRHLRRHNDSSYYAGLASNYADRGINLNAGQRASAVVDRCVAMIAGSRRRA